MKSTSEDAVGLDYDDEGFDEQIGVNKQQGSRQQGRKRPINFSAAIARSNFDGFGAYGEVAVHVGQDRY